MEITSERSCRECLYVYNVSERSPCPTPERGARKLLDSRVRGRRKVCRARVDEPRPRPTFCNWATMSDSMQRAVADDPR